MKKIFQTPGDGNYFFGYYDKSPLNLENTKLLACRSKFFDRAPTKNDVLEIGYFNWQNSCEFVKLTETKAWNWQQGCMLQWLGSDHSSKIIYNDRVDNKFVTILLDIDTRKKEILPMAYYAASNGGSFVLCIDNERHAWHRSAYSYKGIENPDKKTPLLLDDGIWYIDSSTAEVKQILTLKQIIAIKPLSIMKSSVHYVEHLMINPTSKRFAFIHRWQMEDNGIYARLYTANVDGSDIHLLNDSGRMSHYFWRNDSEIVAWAGLSNPVNKLRKYKSIVKYFIKPLMPLYKMLAGGNSVDGNSKLSTMVSGDSYLVFKDKTNQVERLNTKLLTKDGHPSFSKVNENLMITDTYPNINDNYNEELVLYNITQDSVTWVEKLKHEKELARGACRCDLHPKWSHDGKYICVDTLDTGFRSMYLYDT